MHRLTFLSLAFAFYMSLYFPASESLNPKSIINAKSSEKRPVKRGLRELNPKAKEAYTKIKMPKNKTVSHRQGLNFDACETDFDCQGWRFCYGYDYFETLGTCDSSFYNECRCLENNPICSEDSDCSSGEHCSQNLLPGVYFCMSNSFMSETDSETLLVETPGSNGLALDVCTTSLDCQGPLKCYMLDSDGWYADCNSLTGKECFCDYDFESEFDGSCANDAVCLAGEVCSSFSIESGWCTSDTAYQGFNFDLCYSSADCREPRSCYGMQEDGSFTPCTTSDALCTCLKDDMFDMLCTDLNECAYWAESCFYEEESGLSICVSDSQLALLRAKSMSGAIKSNAMSAIPSPELSTEGIPKPSPENQAVAESTPEVLADGLEMGSGGQSSVPSSSVSPNVSPDATPDISPEASPVSDDVCIAVHSLAHFESHELIYDTHRVARVLCDENNSCATPGHIVQYQNTPMMMMNYCEIVQCKADIMHVNSPRYRRGMHVPSMTEGLVFTTFAARYGTKTEERLLATAVRFGL